MAERLDQRLNAFAKAVGAELKSQKKLIAALDQRVSEQAQALADMRTRQEQVQVFMAGVLKDACDTNRRLIKTQHQI